MRKLPYFVLGTLLILTGCSSLSKINNEQSEKLIDKNNIKLNLEFLASDELEGREATTLNERIAALYITTQLQRDSIEPFFGDTSYLQPFGIKASTFPEGSGFSFTDTKSNSTIGLKIPDDFLYDNRNSREDIFIDTAQIVFAGYGITAPEYNYDDYLNLDVKGKMVIVMNGEPITSDTILFEGNKETKYSLMKTKVKNAKEHGAIGIINPATVSEYLQKWDSLKNIYNQPTYSLDNTTDIRKYNINVSSIFNKNFISICINPFTLNTVFMSQVQNFYKLEGKAKKGEPLPHFTLNGKFNVAVRKVFVTRAAYNIVGLIEGNDPVLKHEYVVLGAHYDHLGMKNGKIFNGADHDGSGVAAVMEIAKAFAKSHNNKRSIMFVFHSGEEKGLLGSEYLTDTLDLIKQKKIVAEINLDMIGRGSQDTIYSIGSNKLSTEMKQIVEQVNSNKIGMVLNYKFDNPNDPNKFYYRSDHYNYAKHGIPVVFFFDGMAKDYHQISDDVDKINFEKIKRVAMLVYGIAKKIANLNHRLSINKSVD